ncbi:hypothetical protein ACP275_12G141100 [Erythranthe tilingii]
MSLLARVKYSAGRRLLFLRPSTALQQSDFHSTRSANISQKTQKSTTPKSRKSSEPSSAIASQRTKKQAAPPPTVWPKPVEIPYQAKVSNFVNLIGHVVAPIRFEEASDGNHIAATVISQPNSGEKNSMLTPVLFGGDLAHVVACHVKENDCVLVSGQLSVSPIRFALNDSPVKFHVVVENLNFVQGLKRNASDQKLEVSFSSLEIDKPVAGKIDEVIEKMENDDDFNQQWQNALEHAKVKVVSGDNDWASSNSVTQQLDADSEAILKHVESNWEKCNDKSVEWAADKKKDGDLALDFWSDLVKNPLLWWDYRNHKSNGLVKEKFPDFKHKGTGKALWVNDAPKWVLPDLEKLEFDVKVINAKPVQGVFDGSNGRKSFGKGEDSWKNLVENPNKWWDNRADKRNPRAPDFKHKETGDGLWLSDSPSWALTRLPPLKDGQNTANKYAPAM